MIYLSSAFSLNMLNHNTTGYIVSIVPIEENDILKEMAKKAISIIGHEGTAQVVSEILGIPIKANRTEIKLSKGDTLIVAQISGRQPEGKILTADEIRKLPIQWWKVEVR